jgi:YVTN family beta-propeller protein
MKHVIDIRVLFILIFSLCQIEGCSKSNGPLREGMIYVSHVSREYVSVLDPIDYKLDRKIKAGNGPCSIELSPRIGYGYIGNYKTNDVTVFDAKSGSTITTVAAGVHPGHLLLTSDSRYLLIGHESPDGIWFLDTRTNQIVKKLTEGTGIFCRDDAGKKIYQSQIFIPFVFVIDPTTQSIVKKIEVGGRPLDIALTPDGRSLYVANFDLDEVEQIDTQSDSVVARIPNVGNARGIAVTGDGKIAFVTNVRSSTVTVIDLASRAIVKTIAVGRMPTSIALSVDKKYAYVSCQGNESLAVIDVRTHELLRSVSVDDNPIQVQVR